MPVKHKKLSFAFIKKISEWIDYGAPYDKPLLGLKINNKEMQITQDDRQYWAFRPIQKPIMPTVNNADWAQNEIDLFILSKLESAKIHPNSFAKNRTLIRRVYFDLIGLPPTPEEVELFLLKADGDPRAALESVVDRLLNSPHYGERWGRHWLDLARYADSFGFEIRFKNPNGFEGEPMPARDKDYNIEYEIYPAKGVQIAPIATSSREFANRIDTLNYDEYKDKVESFYKDRSTCITCSANHSFGGGYEIRINHDGTVWPCSFFGHLSKKYLKGRTVSKVQQWQAQDIFKDINNNLEELTLKEILDSDPFHGVYSKWEGNKIMLCSDVCGENKMMEKIYA